MNCELKHLSLLNYRNIAECDLRFSRKFNCFLGNNGMGKTNLLDSVLFLSLTKSHLTSIDSQLVRHDQPFLMMQAEYSINDIPENLNVTLKPKVKKIIKRNGKIYTRMSDHIGLIPVVLISPADQSLIADGSDERRRFMDIVISQCDSRYLNSLSKYNRIIQNRNNLLKQLAENSSVDSSLLEIYDLQLQDEAEYIYEKRHEFIEKFIPTFQKTYNKIAAVDDRISLQYVSHLDNNAKLSELLRECQARDIILGYTTRGIHKDDLIMSIGNYPIRTTGSQGQNKSFVIAMKLAQYKVLNDAKGCKPILLLDDLFDRLDTNRVSNIIDIVASDEFGQIFITDTSRNNIDKLLNDRESSVFEVTDGRIKLISVSGEPVLEQ